MATHESHGDPDRNPDALDQLNFDHHREERYRTMDAPHADQARRHTVDAANDASDQGWRGGGAVRSFSRGSQEFGREGYGGGHGEAGYGAREWTGTESWRVPGPFTGRGPRGYQPSDERIREQLNDRLTAHGFIDATYIECHVIGGEVTLSGVVDSREAKRAAAGVATGIPGVHRAHDHLRVGSHASAGRPDASDVPQLPELP